MIQFYSIPGPYTILAACGHSVAGTGENKQQCNKKLPSSHHFGGSPCIREALCPQLWIGDLARLLAVCWGKIHPIESNPQNTVLATDALNKTTLIRNTFLQVGTGPLFFSGQQLPYLWIIQINESFSGQVLVLKTCKKIRRIIFVTKNSAWHHPPKKKKRQNRNALSFRAPLLKDFASGHAIPILGAMGSHISSGFMVISRLAEKPPVFSGEIVVKLAQICQKSWWKKMVWKTTIYLWPAASLSELSHSETAVQQKTAEDKHRHRPQHHWLCQLSVFPLPRFPHAGAMEAPPTPSGLSQVSGDVVQ